jgi:hypothetical protein
LFWSEAHSSYPFWNAWPSAAKSPDSDSDAPIVIGVELELAAAVELELELPPLAALVLLLLVEAPHAAMTAAVQRESGQRGLRGSSSRYPPVLAGRIGFAAASAIVCRI